MAEPLFPKARRPEVRVRSADHVERLALALVREAVAFDVRPEANGWWLVRATPPPLFPGTWLQQLEQSTRFERG